MTGIVQVTQSHRPLWNHGTAPMAEWYRGCKYVLFLKTAQLWVCDRVASDLPFSWYFHRHSGFFPNLQLSSSQNDIQSCSHIIEF